MRKAVFLSIFTVTVLVTLGQDRITFKADFDTASEEQIKRLEFTLAGLLERGEIDAYSGYLTEDYIRISANGEIATKEQVLQGFRKSSGKGNTKMYPHDLKVHVYGETAILHAKLDLEIKSGDTTTKRSSLITKVFIKRNGSWFMASLQGTAVK
ncbi:MAG TPA: nuclear transport factor 2 family protein [Chitinophagaceae bacterium]|nr:nuclear transport factor 2 family protein [Chitinophagaceae bacterium]